MWDWPEEASKKEGHQNEVLSFDDYMELFKQAPHLQARPTYEYLIDMLNHFKKNEQGHFNLFQTHHSDAHAIHGQHRPQEALYQNLVNFQEEGFNSKFILLVGPNGSSKSGIIKKFMKGAEEYSHTNEGALYSFSWIFPIDNVVRGTLGLATSHQSQQVQTYAYLDDKDISAILPSELKDHPLLLIPLNFRQEIINEALKDKPRLLESVQKSYLYKGDLSKRNREIFDALLKNYRGDHREVLKHIRIERFTISKRYSSSAVTIEPQLHVDARMQQITMDKRLAGLPPSLQSLNLFSMQGEVVLANRGILEFSDLLKRPLDAFKYLLMTMESATINLGGILTELDIFFIGTSNEIHLAAFKQHPDYNSFKGRFNFIRVPYLLDYKEEEKIYLEQIDGLKDKAVFAPHALTALCKFSVMTRLRAPQAKNYEDKKLSSIVCSLGPLEKSNFLSTMEIPDNLDVESGQMLKGAMNDILGEFENENLYEGKFGLSPRDVKKVIYKLASYNKNITFLEVLEYLARLIQKKHEYDFLNMTPQGDFHHPQRFITLIRDEMLDIFDKELRESLGLIDDRSYEDYISRYIVNVTAFLKGEKIKNTITGKYSPSDEYFIKEFESSISLKEDPKSFRSHLMAKLGAYSLDNPGKKISYCKVFPDLVDKLREAFREEQRKHILNISKNLVYFEPERGREAEAPAVLLSQDDQKLIMAVVENLMTKFHYSKNTAISLLKTLLKERY